MGAEGDWESRGQAVRRGGCVCYACCNLKFEQGDNTVIE